MTRTKLCDRILPDYTKGEEIFNTFNVNANKNYELVFFKAGLHWKFVSEST